MHDVVLNGIAYRRCAECRFLSAHEVQTGLDHYAHKEAGLTKLKQEARERNSISRLQTVGAHGDCNNLCDIGAGEGNTLSAAYKLGYRNLVGIEPAEYVETLPKDNRYTLIRGAIEDLGRVAKDYGIANASMFHVVEHLPHAIRDLKAIHDVLPSGGYLMIETPDSDSYAMRVSNYNHDLIYPEHVSLFNAGNLSLALKHAGFSVVAQGRRDFDAPISIDESLKRLGVRPYRQIKNRMQHSYAADTPQMPEHTSAARSLVRRLLYIVVRILRREDYLWVVARKP